jgi:hydroxymethylpyrimidine/phosphomethylpyrimidine kinase
MARSDGMNAVLTIAGSDPSGGAGIQMDLKCFAAAGVHGCAALTAVTAQNTDRVLSVHPMSPKIVKDQLDAVYNDLEIAAVKTGMLYEASIVEVVAAKVAEEGTALIVDPVLTASVGASLSKPDLIHAIRDRLIPKALLVTPNIPEAEELVGMEIRGEEDMRIACQQFHQLGCESVLLKGGHLRNQPANDLFYDGRYRMYQSPRLDRNVHGTGCMLSAFIAAHLGNGVPLQDSIGLAKDQLTEVIRFGSDIGRGMAVGDPLIGMRNASQMYGVLIEVHRGAEELEGFLPVSLIPDAGLNLAFALTFSSTAGDVCALEGRMVRVGSRARRAGFPAFGASRLMAAVVLAAMEHDRRFRCAVNLRYSKPIVDLCRTLGLKIGSFDRRREPDDVSKMGWGAHQAISALGFVPDVIYDEGDVGKEPMMRVLGESPKEVVGKVRAIVKGLKDEKKEGRGERG